MEILGALLAGAFIGSVLGFVGAGGAMLSVPILIYLFEFTPHHASTAALAIVFASATAGVIPKFKKGEVLLREGLTIWLLGMVANIGGSWVSRFISDSALLFGFSLVLISAATSMWMKPPKQEQEKKIPLLLLIIFSLAIGLMTGLFGVGGGFLAIPILVKFFKTPLAKATGTSLLIIALNCSTAFFAHASSWKGISWQIPIIMALGAIIISTLASQHSARISPLILRRSFSIVLLSIAAFTLIHTLLLSNS